MHKRNNANRLLAALKLAKLGESDDEDSTSDGTVRQEEKRYVSLQRYRLSNEDFIEMLVTHRQDWKAHRQATMQQRAKANRVGKCSLARSSESIAESDAWLATGITTGNDEEGYETRFGASSDSDLD